MCWCICMTPNHCKRLTKPLPQNFSFKTRPSWEKLFISSGHGGGLNFPLSSSPTPPSSLCFKNFLFHGTFSLLASLLYSSVHNSNSLAFQLKLHVAFSRILIHLQGFWVKNLSHKHIKRKVNCVERFLCCIRHGSTFFCSISLWNQRRGSESDEAAAFLNHNTIILINSSCTTTPEEKEKPTWNTKQVS